MRNIPSRSRAANPPRISVVGGIVLEIEWIPDVDEFLDSRSLDYFPGGKGVNPAVAAYRAIHMKPQSTNLDVSSPSTSTTMDKTPKCKNKEGPISSNNPRQALICMNGAVGDDPHGTTLQRGLVASGVDVSGVRTVPGQKTGTCIVLVEIANGKSRKMDASLGP